MDEETRAYIGRTADAVRTAAGISVPAGENMQELVHILGGCIVTARGQDALYDGSVCKAGPHAFMILVRDFTSPEHQNFEIACALGHLFLHMGYLTGNEFWARWEIGSIPCFSSDMQIEQANLFAEELLMPHGNFQMMIEKCSDGDAVNIAEVAGYYKVPVGAAIHHAKDMQLIA